MHLNNYNIPFHYSPLKHEKMISNKYCWNLFCCIFLLVNLTKAEKPLIHEEKVDLIHNLLRWMKGFDVLTEQRCFTLNFGYQQPFPFPQLWLGLDSTLTLNVGSLGNKALELETKVAEDYTKFYNHGAFSWLKAPTCAFSIETLC